MSMMNKIKSMLKGHESKAAKGIDVAGNLIDRKTHGKYRRHVGKAQSRLKQELGTPGTHGDPRGGPGQTGHAAQPGQTGNPPQPGQPGQPGQHPGNGPYGGGQSGPPPRP